MSEKLPTKRLTDMARILAKESLDSSLASVALAIADVLDAAVELLERSVREGP